jgi:hypothetical protein
VDTLPREACELCLIFGQESPVWKSLQQGVAKNLRDGDGGFLLINMPACGVIGSTFIHSEGQCPSR